MERELHIDNHTLVEECRKGDKEALNLFYLRFAPRMLSIIRRYVGNVKDAEDILHDGFIVAFTRLGSLRDADKVDYWLATIMKNLSLRFLQSQDVAQMLHDIPEVEDTPSIDEIIDLATIENLIKKLPPGYQKVFRLAVLENKSHKEIAKLLGIAPNSSSSQLFHAKIMMRRLIADYKKQMGVWCLLLLCAGGVLLWNKLGRVRHLPEVMTAGMEQSIPDVSLENIAAAHSPGMYVSEPDVTDKLDEAASRNRKSNVDNEIYDRNNDEVGSNDGQPWRNDEIREAEVKEGEVMAQSVDSVETERKIPLIIGSGLPSVYTDNRKLWRKRRSLKSGTFGGWSLRLSADAGLLAFNTLNSSDDSFANDNNFNQGGVIPPNPDDPTDPDNPYNPDRPDSDEKRDMARRRILGYQDYNRVAHTNYLPISFSLTVNKSLNQTFSVETGLTYTYLHSTFESFPSVSDCRWHYLGAVVRMNVNICSFQRVRMYAGAGGVVNIPLYSKADVTTVSGTPKLWEGRFNSPVVWSLSASYGISFKLTDRVDIFLEPTLQYHFEHEVKVPNIWSDNQWGFSLPVGFRFNL